MDKTYCPGMKRQTIRFIETLKNIYICVFNLVKDKKKNCRKEYLLYNVIFHWLFLKVMRNSYPWNLTERVVHWPRHFCLCPLLLMCCLHLSHQMCLCAASNTRCTQCWNAPEKYIQRLDRALALSQHSEVGMATAVQSYPHPLLPHQPPSLFKNAPCLPYIGSCHHR